MVRWLLVCVCVCVRLVMNYLVTEGYADAARRFSIESGAALVGAPDAASTAGEANKATAMDVDRETGAAAAPADAGASSSMIANIDDRMAVRASVQRGNIEAAIDKVNDINPNILEESGQVYFKLQQQRLIELIRQGKVEEALGFAHQYLAPRGEENVRPCALERLISQYRLHAEMHVSLESVCVCMLLLSARVR